MDGRLIYVIGASGAGKDSVIDYAKKYFSVQKNSTKTLLFVQRHITRPATSGGEDHIAIDESTFTAMLSAGEFIMHWHSHGLYYGIHNNITKWLKAGKTAVLNGSRQYLPTALTLFPNLVPVEVFVPIELLRQRLIDRGRESTQDIENRLLLAKNNYIDSANIFRINNSVDIAEAGSQLVDIISG